MQTKKRAKPVKFGKAASVGKEKKEIPKVKEEVKKAEVVAPPVVEEEKPTAVVEVESPKNKEIVSDSLDIPVELKKQLDALQEKEPEELEEIDEKDTSSDSEESDEEKTPSKVTFTEQKEDEEPARNAVAEADVSGEDDEEDSSREHFDGKEEPNPFSLEESAFGSSRSHREKKTGGLLKHFILVAFVAFLLGLAFIAGGYYAVEKKNLPMPAFPNFSGLQSMVMPKEPTPTEEPKPTVAPSPKKVDLTKYTIKILNGSGITGEASRLKEALTEEGFTVDTTGNADNSDYDLTSISVKKSVDDAYVTKLTGMLEKTYKVESKVQGTPDSFPSDVVITIGKETAK